MSIGSIIFVALISTVVFFAILLTIGDLVVDILALLLWVILSVLVEIINFINKIRENIKIRKKKKEIQNTV